MHSSFQGAANHRFHILLSRNTMPVSIHALQNQQDIESARLLFREYQSEANDERCFQSFSEELAMMPEGYQPPTGQLLLASDGGRIIGCVGLRYFGLEECEMKRLFVIPEYRAKRIGQMLIGRIIDEAIHLNYKMMRLETLPTMKRAQYLYEQMGFQDLPKISCDTPCGCASDIRVMTLELKHR